MDTRLRLTAVVIALASSAILPATATAATSGRADADTFEAYFPSSDGLSQLHADVLRPKGLPDTTPTPVILTVSPYTSHSGGTTEAAFFAAGPNRRFFDFLDLSGALRNGYTYVMVDLPGTGGSAGCNDWGGTREQLAVHSAVEWATSQPWSTGKVALFGKSYDGWTGLMGVATQPTGLAAVVSMEPVYAGYRYKYMNGVRRPNFATTMAAFQVYDAIPGSVNDTPQYHVNGAPQAWCYPVNMAGTIADDDADGPFWRERELVPTARDKATPIFLMQGFLETNTKPDGAFEYWNGLSGESNRAWFGQFDHVRGWERSGGRYETGRSTYVTEAMRFLDLHLKGIVPPVEDPVVAVQDALGRYRAEPGWPPPDSVRYETTLRKGTYSDHGNGNGLRPSATERLWNISEPMPHDVWLSGEPVVTTRVDAVPNANIAANVYDISPDGRARMISRGVSLLRGVGHRTASLTLYGQDWPIAAGNRIGVLISSSNADEFSHVPTRTEVSVLSASISLPFLTVERTAFIHGVPTQRLQEHMASATVLEATILAAAQVPFTIPPPLAPAQAE